MSIYVNNIPVKGQVVKVVTINHEESNGISVNRVHHLLLLDRSGSMHGDIDALIEDVKRSLAAIADDDLITIIWFSGPGQFKTVVKGARKSENLAPILDALKSTVGTTCFSEPLAESETVVDELAALCPYFSVTLFTDGQPVVPWSDEEERIMAVLGSLGSKVIAVNTIGYGRHYNQKLLLDMATATQYGVYNHSSRITDYSALFGHNYERVRDLNIGLIEVKADQAQIMYLGDKNTMLHNNVMRLTMLEKRRNQVFIVGKDDQDFTFEYNGEVYDTRNIKSPRLLPTTLRNMYYAYAYNMYYRGNREDALAVLFTDLGDKALVNTHMSAFTFDEVERQSVAIRKAIFKTKYRHRAGVCEPNYLPKEDAVCVMDVLRVLSKGDNYYVAPFGNGRKYKRIGKKVIDVFGSTQLVGEEARSLFADNMMLNEEKMNVSFRVQMPVDVTINPRSASRVGLPEVIRAKQYRAYAVVKDGALNQDEIEALVDEPTYNQLQTMGVDTLLVTQETTHKRVVINLTALPVINRMYTRATVDEVFAVVKTVTEAQAQQKVLNYMLSNMEKANFAAFHQSGHFVTLTKEQIEVLKDHGINNKYEYNPISVKTESIGDTYETRSLVFDLKNFAALPKVEDVLAKMGKKADLTPSQAMMADFIDALTNEASTLGLDLKAVTSKEFIDTKLKAVKKTLLEERMKLNIVKMGKILTGGWFENLEADGKGNYNYTKDGYTLVVKPKRELIAI